MNNLVKRLIAPLMLSATLISNLNGCMTVSPWQIDRIVSTTGQTQISNREIGTKIKKEKEFKISDFYLVGNEYQAKVTESLKETDYNLYEQTRTTKVYDRVFERQVTEISYEPLMIGGLGLLGLIGGGVMSNGDQPLFILLGLSLGMGVGGSLKMSPAVTVKTREKGTRERIEFSGDGRIEAPLTTRLIYSENNPGEIAIGFKNDKTFFTDISGKIILLESENVYFTKERLAERLKDFPLMQQIKPNIKSKLEGKILKATTPKIINPTIETRESSFDSDLTIINDSKYLQVEIYKIESDLIYSVVGQFVDEEINAKIKPVKFKVEDRLTHFPIRNSHFRFNSSAPSKSELAGEYFTGELKEFAKSIVNDYLIGESFNECNEALIMQIYCPSKINLEVVHFDYNFVQGEFEVKTNRDKKVYMIDKGQKVRLATEKESLGGIE